MPLGLIALVDEVRAHLEQGDLAGLGPIDLGPDGVWPDAEHLARIVLADVDHWVERGRMFGELIPAEHWAALGDQLQRLERVVRTGQVGGESGWPSV